MNFGSWPQSPSGAEDRSPERRPMPDRHSADFAVGVLFVAMAVGIVAFVALVVLLLLSGVGGVSGIGVADLAQPGAAADGGVRLVCRDHSSPVPRRC